MWSAAFCARMRRCRPPVRSPSTSSRISSTAMRCNFLSRRTAWYAMFKLTVPHAASGRCRTRQHRCALVHQFPADPEFGFRLAHMDTQKMKMTGVNGPRVAFELMMIGGDLDRVHSTSPPGGVHRGGPDSPSCSDFGAVVWPLKLGARQKVFSSQTQPKCMPV